MKEITQWNHFKRNYLFFSIAFCILGAIIILYAGDVYKWTGLIHIGIGVIVFPVGNYLSWKKKFKK